MGLTRKQMEAEAAVKHLKPAKTVEIVVEVPAPKPKKVARKKAKKNVWGE